MDLFDHPLHARAHDVFATAEALARLVAAALALAALATLATSVAASVAAGCGWLTALQHAVWTAAPSAASGPPSAIVVTSGGGSWLGWSAGATLCLATAVATLLQRWLSGWVAQFVFVNYDKNHPGKRP